MALDIDKIIMEAFFDLSEKKELKKITITDILQKTGIGRQTFYNHFKDKDDLINYCFDKRINIVVDPDEISPNERIESVIENITLKVFVRMYEHKKFLKSACMMDGPNCLKTHLYNTNLKTDIAWDKALCRGEYTQEIQMSSLYHSAARTYMTLMWILSDFPGTPEELVKEILRNRTVSLRRQLLRSDENRNKNNA